MLVRQLARGFRTTLRLERRCYSVEPSTNSDNVDPIQNEALDKDLCLLVDEKDNFLGPATKRDCHRVREDGSLLLHRAFSVFIFNKRGDMLMQRRSSTKVTYPDHYTNACCSHPLFLDNKQEDVIAAARRRLNLELGIPPDQLKDELFTYMTRVHYMDGGDGVWGEHEMDHILVYRGDVKLSPNSDEVSEIAYVPKEEFNAYIPTLEGPMTPWFDLVRRNRLKLWWDNLHRLHEVKETNKILRFDNKK